MANIKFKHLRKMMTAVDIFAYASLPSYSAWENATSYILALVNIELARIMAIFHKIIIQKTNMLAGSIFFIIFSHALLWEENVWYL